MYAIVWRFKNQDPAAIYTMYGSVATFTNEPDARAFARKGHPMHKGRYRVVKIAAGHATS